MENAKRHFAISELAKEFDVSKRHIRFCEEKGLISPRITKLNRRIYSSYDRARLKLIFHCVLIGYSQDHIVELIGMPDADLDEADQIKKGLAYAERMIEELDKRRNELSFHQRTSVINEIKMLGEYIKEIKAIPLETSEKSAAKPLMPDKESKDTAYTPVEEIKPEVEQRPERQPVRMAPLYIAGLAIVLIIGGFFYYQSSKKDSEPIYLVQKEPAKTETQSVYHDRVPIDNTGDQKNLNPRSTESSAAEKAAAEKAAAEKAAAEKAAAEKAAAEKAAAKKAAAEKAAAEKAAAVAIGTPLIAKSAVEKPEAAVVEAKEAEINKDAQPEAVAKVAPDLPNAFPEPEKQESVSVPNLQASEAEIKEGATIEESDIKEPLFTAETDTSLPQELKTESPGAVEESTPSIGQEEDKETLASKGEILSQQDRKDRLESFLNIYCQTYASKDLDKFATFFTPDATENNTPFQDMLPKYRKNLEKIQSFNYRIELIAYSLQADTGNIKIQGKYFTRYLLHEGTWRENNGNLSMELTENDDSYLVKRLNYGQ
ncbi:MAG: MerR family transcriptional regulator [Desulfobacterales bacterium]